MLFLFNTGCFYHQFYVSAYAERIRGRGQIGSIFIHRIHRCHQWHHIMASVLNYACMAGNGYTAPFASAAAKTRDRFLKKEVREPWAPAGFFARGRNQGVWGTEVPQQDPGAEPRWGSGDEAPRSWRHSVKKDTQTLFPVRWHHLQVGIKREFYCTTLNQIYQRQHVVVHKCDQLQMQMK